MSQPKYKIGDVVTMNSGWDRIVPHVVTITTVSANHGRQGDHRYWGRDKYGYPHGFYEDQVIPDKTA